MPVSAADFLAVLRSSGVLEPEQVSQLDALSRQFPDPKAFAQELVRRGWLTPFQARLLTSGQGHQLVIDQYVLLAVLGQGGMGAVYQARQRFVNRIVALKVIRRDVLKSPNAAERFRREAQVAAQLAHPNVVTLFDAREVAGVPFLVMEFIDGTDLAQLVAAQGALPVVAACDYIRQAACGLAHAHEHGLVHRDIKPHNLMRTKQGVVKVMDLGLARTVHAAAEASVGGGLTPSGAVMGTPDYLAPEQAQDAKYVDIRADIYSLGCTLYHLLAGQVPFPGGTLANKIVAHLMTEPQALTELRPDVPAGLAAVVQRMMAKTPEARFATPAEVATALAPWAASDSSEAPEPPRRRTDCQSVLPMPQRAETMAGRPPAPTLTQPPPPRKPPVRAAPAPTQREQRRPKPVRQRKWLTLGIILGVLLLLGVGALVTWAVLAALNRPAVVAGKTERTLDPGPPVVVTQAGAPPKKKDPDPVKEDPPKKKDPDPVKEDPPKKGDLPDALVLHLKPGVTMELVLIKKGRFRMGSPDEDKDASRDEKPQHDVEITQDFYMAKYPVTQEQYKAIMGDNPSYFSDKGDGKDKVKGIDTNRFPVENVSWNEATDFCKKVSELAKRQVKLPTEAQWEYACRAGTTTKYYCGDTLTAEDAKFNGKVGHTTAVDKYPKNKCGLYDMSGNVWQWCADSKRVYTKEAQTNPYGGDDNSVRVLRGGSWSFSPWNCRSACRLWLAASYHGGSFGFRVVVCLD